MKFSAEASSL